MWSITPSAMCPHCHRDDQVQKVSAAVAEGTATGTSYGWTVGHAGHQRFQGNTVTWSRQQSMLAAMLAAHADHCLWLVVERVLPLYCWWEHFS